MQKISQEPIYKKYTKIKQKDYANGEQKVRETNYLIVHQKLSNILGAPIIFWWAVLQKSC